MIDDQTKEDIRERTDLVELCEALGLAPKGKVARCPAHADQGTPNLHIYPDHVYCFRCEWHADAFELVAKVKGCDFPASFDFLAVRLGLPLIQDLRKSGAKGRGLGNGNRGEGAPSYPKPSPLPATPSPTLATSSTPDHAAGEGSDLGYTVEGEGASTYPKPAAQVSTTPAGGDVAPLLPPYMWQSFDDFAVAWAYWEACQGYRRALGKEDDRFFVRATDPSGLQAAGLDDLVDHAGELQPLVGSATVAPPRRSLRVEVFAALLAQGVRASTTAAGAWLHKAKGVELATQDRFGLVFLEEPRRAAGELIKTYGLDVLLDLGVYGKRQKDGKPYFGFKTHRLLFPFNWKGEPVDVQGRDVEATDKNRRFHNTAGKNPIPYNADALLDAKTTGAPVFVCEGATDTLTLAQSGRAAVGIVGTGGFKAAWLPYFKGLDVFLAFDGDDAGRRAAKTVTKTFVEGGLPAPKTIIIPTDVKDVTELFRGIRQ